MSILIRGMEMPVTCCHCPLMGYDPDIEWNDGGRETQGAYICVMTHELIDNTKREDHCPLVEIPPHGDLIDREALMDDIIGSMVFSGRNVPKEAAIVQKVLDIVGDANAILEAEEDE